MLETLGAVGELGVGEEVFPLSARTGKGVGSLVADLVARLPEGPMLYPAEDRTDLAEETLWAELVREQVLRRTRQEVPHAVEIEIGRCGKL